MSSKFLYKCNLVFYELKNPRYTIFYMWNCFIRTIRKLKINMNSKFLYRYEINAMMLKIRKQMLTNFKELKLNFKM